MLSTSELFSQKAVSPLLELGAYEELWMQERQSFKNLATLLHNGNYLPSDLVEEEQARKRAQEVFGHIEEDVLSKVDERLAVFLGLRPFS